MTEIVMTFIGHAGEEQKPVIGGLFHPVTASDPADQEANALRAAESMIRDLFRRWRDREARPQCPPQTSSSPSTPAA